MIAIRGREDFEKLSIEDLIHEQQIRMKEIIKFEDKHILHKDKNDSKPPFKPMMIESPSPSVRWRVISKELITITELLDEKTRDEYGIGIDYY